MDPKDLLRSFGSSALDEVRRQLEGREQLIKGPTYDSLADIHRLTGALSMNEEIARQRDLLLGFGSVSESVRQTQQALTTGRGYLPGMLGDTIQAARLAGALELPDQLQGYRLQDTEFASRLWDAGQRNWWADSQVGALNSHAALSQMLDASTFVRSDTLAAAESVLAGAIPGMGSLRDTFEFLDIAGLLRLPRYRVRTIAEKRRRLKSLVRESAPPAHVRKAHSLSHGYEVVLRQVIWQAMTEAYGEDWPATRLPSCGCKKLLGTTLAPGETVLDSADFAHYVLIMCDEEHFETVFSKGYENRDALREMLARLRHLRGRSHHARTFTSDDLREFTTTWRLIAAGWPKLIHEEEIEF